jgi:hypothetical protein
LAEDLDKIESTLLRFVVALDAAIDETKYKEEYAKKLYKLLSPSNDSTDSLQYFVKFSAGELPRSALASFVKQVQLQRKLKKGPTGEKYWWSVGRPGHGASVEVVASSREEAIEKGRAEYPDWSSATNITAKPLRPYDSSPVRASVGEPQPAGAVGSGEFTGTWKIVDGNGRELHRFSGIGNNQTDANRFAIRWLTSNGYGHGTEVSVLPVMG